MRVQIVKLDANANYTLTTKQLSLVSLVRPNFTLAAVLYLFYQCDQQLSCWLAPHGHTVS